VYRNGIRVGVATISSGRKGYETPTGVFTILQKDKDHHSNVYDNAPMPYQQRLTWSGVALHAGGVPGYPESHGCVHLPTAFAEKLFAASNMGMTVVVSKPATRRCNWCIGPLEPDRPGHRRCRRPAAGGWPAVALGARTLAQARPGVHRAQPQRPHRVRLSRRARDRPQPPADQG
jgi:hypothetical protein